MPLLGETGCRLAEIVGLELNDIDMENELIHIRPNSIRRLKDQEIVREPCHWWDMQRLLWS
jgi:integrase